MEPRIRYTTTSDGVNIAYWKMGEGGTPTIVVGPLGYSHIGLECRIRELLAWYERLAAYGPLIRYDPRAMGLSQRGCEDLSPDVLDTEAVIKELGFERVNLVGFGGPASTMVEFAALHTDMVNKLVLWDPVLRGADFVSHPRMQAVWPLLEQDYDLFIETWAHVQLGWSAGSKGHGWAAFIKESVSQEDHVRIWQVVAKRNLEPFLERVTAETLVLESTPTIFDRHVREIAAGIAHAQLIEIRERQGTAYWESDTGIAAIEEFLFGTVAVDSTAIGGFATILFTDMESSTALTQSLGDAGAQEVRRAHNDIVRSALSANSGSEIKHTGDGIMASFATASSALDCAIAIQIGVAAHKAEHPDSPLGVYIGLNAGEPIAEDDDLFGTSVDLAARLVEHAQTGQIIASDVVRQLAAGKDFLFADLGETELRGFEDPVKLWELRWEEQA